MSMYRYIKGRILRHIRRIAREEAKAELSWLMRERSPVEVTLGVEDESPRQGIVGADASKATGSS